MTVTIYQRRVTLRNVCSEKQKQYTCVCRASQPISAEQLSTLKSRYSGLCINQTTPIRVLARRTLMLRQRSLTVNAACIGNHPNTFCISLTTQVRFKRISAGWWFCVLCIVVRVENAKSRKFLPRRLLSPAFLRAFEDTVLPKRRFTFR